MKEFPGGFPKAIIMADREECLCAHCKSVIGADYNYLLFTGESLHSGCLTDYLQKLDLLKIVVRWGKCSS